VTIQNTGGEDTLPEVVAIRLAAEACLAKEAVAMVTGPINKEKLVGFGFEYTGHTDFLGALCEVEHPVMAFVGERLNVSLVTVHCPLKAVPARLTVAQIDHVLRQTYDGFARYGNTPHPKLLVCGLNPHAGDGGVLGREEIDVIAPAIAQCDRPDLVGPISAEAAFTLAMKGRGDVVVAMYHDQGLAPLKAVEFGRCVNWTLGLPIIRTSVDHGTAYDLAWKGEADPGSALAAIRWALHCASKR
jgi:4-hydroxythreonine-4-phosphate dehydrogenase